MIIFNVDRAIFLSDNCVKYSLNDLIEVLVYAKRKFMRRTLMSGKIHRATVTASCLDYMGSISIDSALMEAANILPYELVHVVSITNGSRLETYAIPAPAHSGIIQINGAAAHLIHVQDIIIIISYVQVENSLELLNWKPHVVFVDKHNQKVTVSEEQCVVT